MRHLPDNPSVAFLRREAKDLLTALRESNPGASLADAQRALAVEYGVRDWNELKAEVEQQTARTPTAPEELVDELAAAFGLGKVIAPATPVSFRPMGRHWSITTDRGRWLADTVYRWLTNSRAEIGARLRDAGVAAGIAAPTPIRSSRGHLIEPVQGENWRVHKWLDVGPSPVPPTPTAVAHRIGGIFGILHSTAIPSGALLDPHLSMRKSAADWARLLDRARHANKPWAERLSGAIPQLLELHAIDADPNQHFILCNRVLNPENVRQRHNDELVVTEWGFTGSLTPDLELGWALTQWMSRPSINHKGIAALREGYTATAGNWPELGLESFATAVTGYLNWTYNSICEAISPTDIDHAGFAERESVDLLNQPMTRSSLKELISAAAG